MSSVLQLVKPLTTAPGPVGTCSARLRTFQEELDIAPWLELRDRAFARQRVGIRSWTENDFRKEFLEKPWWNPEHLWLAEVEHAAGTSLVGSVTLAMRGVGDGAKAVVHWLMVLPALRRQGIARALVDALERTAWDAGHGEVWLETHVAWTAAAKFYEALGYRPAVAQQDSVERG